MVFSFLNHLHTRATILLLHCISAQKNWGTTKNSMFSMIKSNKSRHLALVVLLMHSKNKAHKKKRKLREPSKMEGSALPTRHRNGTAVGCSLFTGEKEAFMETTWMADFFHHRDFYWRILQVKWGDASCKKMWMGILSKHFEDFGSLFPDL